MAPLAGLSGLYGVENDATGVTDEGVLESHAAPGTPDSAHATWGDSANQSYPAGYGVGYHATAYPQELSTEDRQTGEFYDAAGVEQDETPNVHSAPWPRGIIQDSYADAGMLALASDQMNIPHGINQGGPRAYNQFSQVAREEPTNYTTDRYDAPNTNVLAENIPGQLRGSGAGGGGQAGKDTSQGYGQLNSIDEFTKGHSIRRVQHDPLHFDYTALNGGERPFIPRMALGIQPTFDGPDSPYNEVQGGIDGSFLPDRQGGATFPTASVPIPDPTVAPSYTDTEDVWSW
jgi:hypothetical protein